MKFKRVSIIIVACLVLLFFLRGHIGIDRNTIGMPWHESSEIYYSDGFMDFSIYGKYTYNSKSVKQFNSHTKFKKMTEQDIENIEGYVENFEYWLEEDPLSEHYDFKWSQIKTNDYYYIINEEEATGGKDGYGKYHNYDVYYVDMEKCVMYYLHSHM